MLLLSFVKVTELLLMAGTSLMGGPPASIPWDGAKQPWAFADRLPLLLCRQGGQVQLVEGIVEMRGARGE